VGRAQFTVRGSRKRFGSVDRWLEVAKSVRGFGCDVADVLYLASRGRENAIENSAFGSSQPVFSARDNVVDAKPSVFVGGCSPEREEFAAGTDRRLFDDPKEINVRAAIGFAGRID
jgi:hypothetical protein